MKSINCPFCQSTKKIEKYKLSKYTLFSCQRCQLVFLAPIPSNSEILRFYTRDYFVNNKQLSFGYKNYHSMHEVLTEEAKRKILFIQKFTNNKKLLDIGCGLGIFLKIASSSGYEVSGNDISYYAQNEVKKSLKIPFYSGPISPKTLPRDSFEIVTAWDVFEHIPTINCAFNAVNKSLKKNGFLFFTTPNVESLDAKILRKLWYGYKKIPEHLIFFSPKSVTKVLEKAGFKVVKIQTWGFERDFKFIITKLSLYLPLVAKFILPIFKLFKLENKSIYLPFTDMMVVAQKSYAKKT